jgi:nucleotide-binding universal stress UspA family protein
MRVMEPNIWETFDALYKLAYKQGRQIEDLETRLARLEVYVSELRHAAGLTPVDEIHEAARADAEAA